jgi:hypothetical protein
VYPYGKLGIDAEEALRQSLAFRYNLSTSPKAIIQTQQV